MIVHDFVFREDAIETMHDVLEQAGVKDSSKWDKMFYDIPPADVRGNIRAEWINIMGHQVCNLCGYKSDILPTKFCPNCGSDMRPYNEL